MSIKWRITALKATHALAMVQRWPWQRAPVVGGNARLKGGEVQEQVARAKYVNVVPLEPDDADLRLIQRPASAPLLSVYIDAIYIMAGALPIARL